MRKRKKVKKQPNTSNCKENTLTNEGVRKEIILKLKDGNMNLISSNNKDN